MRSSWLGFERRVSNGEARSAIVRDLLPFGLPCAWMRPRRGDALSPSAAYDRPPCPSLHYATIPGTCARVLVPVQFPSIPLQCAAWIVQSPVLRRWQVGHNPWGAESESRSPATEASADALELGFLWFSSISVVGTRNLVPGIISMAFCLNEMPLRWSRVVGTTVRCIKCLQYMCTSRFTRSTLYSIENCRGLVSFNFWVSLIRWKGAPFMQHSSVDRLWGVLISSAFHYSLRLHGMRSARGFDTTFIALEQNTLSVFMSKYRIETISVFPKNRHPQLSFVQNCR